MNLQPIEIIGGGLAGLSLGIALRRASVPVTIFEAGDYPRHRVCGEFVAGLASSTIERLGIGEAFAGALEHREVAWFIEGAPPQIHRLPAPARGLSRHELDTRLAGIFRALGGDLRTRSRQPDATARPGRVFAGGRRRSARPRWIALKVHVRDFALTRELEMHLGRQGYVGLAKIHGGVVNVCGLFRLLGLQSRGPELLLRYIEATGLVALARRLREADVAPETFCAVAALDFDRRVNASDRISLGDAGAMIPPFTGNGMAMAFQSAELALAPLLAFARGETPWPQTVRATQTALRRRFRVRLASADTLHPFLLRPRRQRWFAALSRARLLPFRPLYAALH
jgi:menaquinone-9 beta-reductase